MAGEGAGIHVSLQSLPSRRVPPIIPITHEVNKTEEPPK